MFFFLFQFMIVHLQSPRKILTDVNNIRKMSLGDEDLTSKQQDSTPVEKVTLASKPAAPFDPTIEPLLKENPRRFVIMPIEYPDIWQMYKKVCKLERINTNINLLLIKYV